MEVKDKPKDLKSTNDLDKHKVDEGDYAYVSFRSSNIKLEEPPALGDSGSLVVHYKCVGDSQTEAADGEIRDKRALKVTWVGKPGQKAPASADENQGSMLDVVDGNAVPSAEATGEDADDSEGDNGEG